MRHAHVSSHERLRKVMRCDHREAEGVWGGKGGGGRRAPGRLGCRDLSPEEVIAGKSLEEKVRVC